MAEPALDIARRTRARRADEARGRLYRAVLAACSRLGIDQDERKALQLDLIGKASMADMSLAEIGRVLDRLNGDWKGPMGHRAHLGKIRALWWTLYWLGEVASGHEAAVSAFVERQTGVTALRFLDHRGAASVIEALKSWAVRAGVAWPTPEQTAAAHSHAPMLTVAQHERIAVLEAIGRRLEAMTALDGDAASWLAARLGLHPDPFQWTLHELDAGIRQLGRILRKRKG